MWPRYYGDMMPWGHMMPFGYGGGVFGSILVLILLIIVIYFVARAGALHGQRSPDQGEKPIEILKKRYAKGEISKSEFDSMKKDLQ